MNFNILIAAGLALVSAELRSKSSSRQSSMISSSSSDTRVEFILPIPMVVEDAPVVVEDCSTDCSHMHCGHHHEHHGCHEECSHANPEHVCHEACHHWVNAESSTSTGSF